MGVSLKRDESISVIWSLPLVPSSFSKYSATSEYFMPTGPLSGNVSYNLYQAES